MNSKFCLVCNLNFGLILDIRFNHRKFRPQSVADSSSDDTESSDYNLQALRTNSSSTSSSDGEESECCPTRSMAPGGKRRVKTGFRSWSKNLSARSNQDNQRDFEEKAMKQASLVFIFKLSFNVLINVEFKDHFTGVEEDGNIRSESSSPKLSDGRLFHQTRE